MWGIISKVHSESLILKGLGALSPIKSKQMNIASDTPNDKLHIQGGIKKGDVVGWHRSKDSKLGEYTAVIKIMIESTEVTCVDFDPKQNILAVGCKNGSIYCYKINQEKIGEQKLHFEVQAHGKERVV